MLDEVVEVLLCWTVEVEGKVNFEIKDKVDSGQRRRLSRALSAGSCVDAALAEEPVMLAVATVVTASEMEAAMDPMSTVNVVDVAATALTGGPVAVGEGAFKIAAKSNCCGAGAAAAMRASTAARAMLDLILQVRGLSECM